MATLTPTKIGPNGTGKQTNLAGALAAATSGGDAYRIQGKEVLVVKNASGSPVTVTITAAADNFGNVSSTNNLTLVVPDGDIGVIGPLDASKFADSNGLAQVTYSDATSVTVGLFTFATTS